MKQMASRIHVSRKLRTFLFLFLATAAAALVFSALPAGAQKSTGVLGVECALIYEYGINKQSNMRAALIRMGCGLEAVPPATTPLADDSTLNPAGPIANVNTITGTETFPKVTQSESMVWSSDGNTIVVNYNDSKTAPSNYSGVSVSTDGGATFTRLEPSPFATGHGTNYGDPIVVYNAALSLWFAGDLTTGCGRQGIGLWTSSNGVNWSVGACAHNGNFDDRESMWVDNNPASPYYGRMYISWNDFAAGQRIFVTHSDDGTTWSSPVALSSGFIRNIQLTGSLDADGTVFVAGMNEGGGGMSNRTNIMYRSTDGGDTWTTITMGPPFAPPGGPGCGYFARIAPIWRHMGWGQPGVGPGGVVHYAYAGRGINPNDEGDIYYTQSLDNGTTWSTPVVLNSDQAAGETRVQWMPSLSVNADGQVVVAWYDRRNTTDGQNYEYWAIQSPDNGASWLPDAPVSDVLIPQPEQPDPSIVGCYAGDYNYHTALGNTAFLTWTDGRNLVAGRSQQDVYFAAFLLGGPSGGTLEGLVTDSSSGTPISGARVRAVGSVERTTLSGADGRYRLRLPADTYDVTASAFGYTAQTVTGVQINDEETTTQDFALVSAPAHQVSGTVTSRATGEPVVNAEVRILGTPLAPARTDSLGFYSFPSVPDGTYDIQASPPQGARCLGPQTRNITFDADVVVDFALDLRVDSFGYACDDTVAFEWVEGTDLLPLTGDDFSIPVPLPFGFSFYGTTYNTLHVSTNGFGNFLGPNSSFSNVCIPNAGPPNAYIGALWDDLLVNRPAGVYTLVDGEAPDRRFIIEWRNVTFFSGPGTATFEIILAETTGDVTLQYNRTDGQGNGASSTVGIENQAGSVGLQYSCNEAALSVGKAIRIFRVTP